ncbi:dTDP-4-dehydrorhamnose reductase [Sulfitobacter sabulilitoris]|uniref:dTDP-4-dehydrorhamnose reductase n=1 Tax=Sulfitobacter sabulilitoris TaxID=2562655 RepID=A0A5S3P7S2_9RHOB|nr:dTDP-4-dehydrorhamnose reductase [Sulfitobacter sabulilitoris]TMM49367.1 dTDP-4-dehydrorhamnose reductase [Sulfitobacter sabulilitoris]
MTLLVFGKTGQVAQALQSQADVIALDRQAADLADPAACARAIRDHAPHAVINAAGWTAVDAAEDNETAATVINAEAPGAMARACADLDIPFIQISTDYVFDGTGTAPFRPDSPVAPLGAYGRSKQRGEHAVAQAGGPFAILRTSWVFSAHGTNFVKTMLRLGARHDRLSVVADQIGGPTPAADIAACCLTLAETLRHRPALSGIYHLSGAPDVSWAGFAQEIFAQSGLDCAVDPIPGADYPQKAQRPANSRLDCKSLEQVFDISRPDWRTRLASVLADLKGSFP